MAAAWVWAAAGVAESAWRADVFGYPQEGDPFTEAHLAVVQQTETMGYEDLERMGFIWSNLRNLVVHLDRSMDIKTQLSVPWGATVGAVKQLLAESDPTGRTDPASFGLKQPWEASAIMRDSDPIPEGTEELDLCAQPQPAPAEEQPARRERKRLRSGSISERQWGADCEAAFELAQPPRWELQERGLGGRSAWGALPEAASAEINAIARRGQRRGSVSLGGHEFVVDLHEMVAVPAGGSHSSWRVLRKSSRQPRVGKGALLQLYLCYAEELAPADHPGGPDGIEGEGLLQLFEDVGVDPAEDIAALAFSWLCGASEMGIFRRREFICGCAALDVDSLDGLRGRMPAVREDARAGQTVAQVYAYTFGVALEPPAKVIPIEEAQQYWAVLLRDWPLREDFCEWACSHMKGKAVNRDLWMMVLKLAREVPPDLSTYDDDPAWPVVMDEFVEHYRALKGLA